MSEEYTLEEVILVDEFAKFIYDWYVENRIIQHAITRADYVRGHNHHTKLIFDDLNELRFLLEERKVNEAISHYGWLDEEVRELVPQSIVDYINKLKEETLPVEEDDDF
jgi:hypothetical protein